MTVGALQDPSVLLSTTPDPVQADPLLQHPHPEALLEPASLAGLPPSLVDLTVARGWTAVVNIAWKNKQNGEY